MDDAYEMTSLQEESEHPEPKYVEGGQRARKAFRERAKPGNIVQIVRRDTDDPKDYLVLVDGHAIGMIQSVGLQLSVKNGLTLAISWPREAMHFIQELWEVEAPQPTTMVVPHNKQASKTLHGIQVTLKRDFHEDKPVDEELL